MWRGLAIASMLLLLPACSSLVRSPSPRAPIEKTLPQPDALGARTLRVKASAFNSLRNQTDSTPNIGAWGDRLTPGMKAIAVSPDLVEMGIGRGQRVRIGGLEGEYVVADRMPPRWQRKIDIYMGVDVPAALHWGVREVDITWIPDGN